MTRVQSIEERIKELTPEELDSLREWFIQFDADAWDRHIAADAASGKLDFLVHEARDEKREGTLKEL